MSAFFQDHAGLAIACALTLIALLVLTAVGLLMHGAKASLRPVVFVGVFFAIVCVPQVLVHGAAALWPKPKLALDEGAVAGVGIFAQPEAVFGPDVDRTRLKDARPVFGGALDRAEIAQLLIRDSGEMAVAARFVDEAGASSGAAALWEMFSPLNTSSDGTTAWGTRAAAGDSIGLRRMGRAVFMWTGPDRGSIDERIRRTRVAVLPADGRPSWLIAFDDWRVAAAAIALLIVIASAWFLKGAVWAARIEPDATGRAPIRAAELERRMAALASPTPPVTSMTKLDDGRWEVIVQYELAWEAGAYRYVLEPDEPNHRVKVLEYLSSRETRAGAYHWKRQMGITFFRKELDLDLQQAKRALVRTVTEAGWTWQPLLCAAPRALTWLAG